MRGQNDPLPGGWIAEPATWVTLTPDGKTAYVANAVTNDVSVIDIASMKEVTRIAVGYVPKRRATGNLQQQ
jgi:YVTN family beta-propeller protein